jgi:hypothetical protein
MIWASNRSKIHDTPDQKGANPLLIILKNLHVMSRLVFDKGANH